MTRREWLMMAGAAAVCGGRSLANPLGMPIGIVPYTVREEMEKDVEGTLRKLAAMGYREIEVSDPFYGKSAREVRALLKSVGLTTPSSDFRTPKDASEWSRSLEDADVLGVKYMRTGVPDGWNKSLDGWKRTFDWLNGLGAACAKAGKVLIYHNHHWEYKTMDGVVIYDEMLRATDPANVKMEMDCFWTTIAGRDPVTYLQKHPGRFPLLHIKDMKKGVETTTDSVKGNPFAEVGSGVIDYKRIFKAAKKSGLKHYFVEQDRWDVPALESARISCEYLKKLSV